VIASSRTEKARFRNFGPLLGLPIYFLIVGGAIGCAGFSSAKSQATNPTNPLQIVTTALPTAILDQTYQASLGAAGGVPPYLWSVGSKQLPAGLSLSGQTGTIAGTATKAGIFSMTVSLSDSSSVPQTVTAALTLQVSTSPQTLAITVSSLPNAIAGQAYSAQLNCSGGTAPFHWSISSGQLPSGVSLNADSGAISGTTTQTGSFAFTAQVTDSESTPQVATKNLSLTATAPASSGATNATGYYGSGLGADALSNLQLGPNGNQVSYRFLASHTGKISALHFYLITDKEGYSGGNGGEVQVNLETDDGSSSHNPSGTVLATYTITNPQSPAPPNNDASFPVVTFASPASVTQGQLYHVVFSNPSSEPQVNFVSVDNLWHSAPSTPVQPTENETDFAVLLTTDGGPWGPLQTYTPILQTDYTDGTMTGNGYMEVWANVPEPIGGTNAVRETFTNSGGNLAVTSASVRVARVTGSGALTVRLEQTDGTLVEQGTVASTALPLSTTTTPTYSWVTYQFSAVHTLFSGQGYNLVLEAPSGTTYQAYPIRKGSEYLFANTTYFADGYAQCQESGGAWTGWTEWGVTNRTDGDLQFYFSTTP
jgi:Putative Ig domain